MKCHCEAGAACCGNPFCTCQPENFALLFFTISKILLITLLNHLASSLFLHYAFFVFNLSCKEFKMKKLTLLAVAALLCSCSQMSQLQSNSSSSDGVSVKMRACLMSEANTRYQAGTLFTNSVTSTATELVKTCTQKLALQSAGISSETQSTAESIISNLKSLAAAQ